jgi:hypothetical protein
MTNLPVTALPVTALPVTALPRTTAEHGRLLGGAA